MFSIVEHVNNVSKSSHHQFLFVNYFLMRHYTSRNIIYEFILLIPSPSCSSPAVAPPPPTGLTSSHISSEDVTLQWDPVDPTLVETIRVEWKIVDRSIGVVDIGKERTSYTIEGLTPGTTYHLTVITVNTVGTSLSEEIPITTLYRGLWTSRSFCPAVDVHWCYCTDLYRSCTHGNRCTAC